MKYLGKNLENCGGNDKTFINSLKKGKAIYTNTEIVIVEVWRVTEWRSDFFLRVLVAFLLIYMSCLYNKTFI